MTNASVPGLSATIAPIAVFVVVLGVVLATYWPVLSAGAQYMDDKAYLESPLIRHPSWASVKAVLLEGLNPTSMTGYYHPLSVLSLMIDFLDPATASSLLPFHRTALLLHLCNVGLVIALLYSLFRNWITAGILGLLYGLHPLNADAVLWIAERKTLLSTFFSLWSVVFYISYARGDARSGRLGWARYGASLVMYACAVLSKPTALPVIALLPVLDYWPLRRLSRRAWIEKAPFAAVCALSAAIALVSQTKTSAFAGTTEIMRPAYVPLVAAYCIGLYLSKAVWPTHLLADYPFPEPLALTNPQVLIFVCVAVLVLAAVVISARRTRILIAGALFFLIALSPTLGIVRYTSSIAANRSMYLPMIGLLLPLGWGASRLWQAAVSRQNLLSGRLAVVVLGTAGATCCIVGTRSYESYWHDSFGLLEYYLRESPNDWKLHTRMGNEWIHRRDYPQAIDEFKEAVRLAPGWTENYLNLGRAFLTIGDSEGAREALAEALRRSPNDWQAHLLMGMALEQGKDLDGALYEYQIGAERGSAKATAHYHIANVLARRGKIDQAVAEYELCLRLDPQFAKARRALDALTSKPSGP